METMKGVHKNNVIAGVLFRYRLISVILVIFLVTKYVTVVNKYKCS